MNVWMNDFADRFRIDELNSMDCLDYFSKRVEEVVCLQNFLLQSINYRVKQFYVYICYNYNFLN